MDPTRKDDFMVSRPHTKDSRLIVLLYFPLNPLKQTHSPLLLERQLGVHRLSLLQEQWTAEHPPLLTQERPLSVQQLQLAQQPPLRLVLKRPLRQM